MRLRSLLLLFILLLTGSSVLAATFVVPADRDMLHRAEAIITGTALPSYARLSPEGGVETVTPVSVDEVIRGGQFAATIDVVEPGGTFNGVSTVIPGVPQFAAGDRVLLLLTRTGTDRWSATDLVLGKFTFRHDVTGRELLVRDEDEIVGWDPQLQPYHEPRRDAALFLQFVRNEVHHRGAPTADYTVDVAPLTTSGTDSKFTAQTNATYTATSYTMTISGTMGSRWTVFPSAVNFYTGATQEAGAPGGGVTAAQVALNAWDADPNSNVNYVYAGTDTTHTQGLHAADGVNTILFERDLSAWGVTPFTCSATGYSGTLGLGGVTSASGTNTLNGETFVTTREGDVEMNRGLANCTLLFSNGDFNSAVAHEVGHTLGFRHADQTRDSSAACTTDPTLECSTQAIMKSFVSGGLNAVLQPWDQHAVQMVYPGTTAPPPPTCTVPAITSQSPSTTITAGQSTTLTIAATNAVTYQWYLGGIGDTSKPVGSGATVTVTPTATTAYWARVTNSCGSASSSSVIVTVTQPPACTMPVITSQPTSRTITSGSSTTLSVTATNATSYQWYSGPVGTTTTPVGSTASITVKPTATTTYWVRVLNACGSVNSSAATVTVTSSTPPPTTSCVPQIVAPPRSSTVTAGQSVTLSANVVGSDLHFLWYSRTTTTSSWTLIGQTPSITVTPTITTYYLLTVYNTCGSVGAQFTLSMGGSACVPVVITPPPSVSVAAGQSVTLGVNVAGSSLKYLWYSRTDPTAGWTLFSTSPSVTLTPSVTTYLVQTVYNSCGSVSNQATLSVR